MKNILKLKKNVFKVISMVYKYDKKVVFIYFSILLYRISFPVILSYLWKYIIDYIAYDKGIVLYYAVLLFGIYCILLFFDKYFYKIYYNQYLTYLMRSILQNKIVYKFVTTVSNFDMGQLEDSKTHDLIAKTNSTMIWHIPVMIESFANLLVGIVSFIIILIILGSYNILVPLILIIIHIPKVYYQLKKSKVEYSMWDVNTPNIKSIQYIRSLLLDKTSIRELKMFNATKNMLKKLNTLQEEIFSVYKKPMVDYNKKVLIPTLIVYISIFFILIYFLNSFIIGVITLGTLIFIKDNVLRFSDEIESVYGSITDLYNSNKYAEGYFNFLNMEPSIKDSKDPKLIDFKRGIEIEFKNVSFKYPSTKKYALKNISFKINKGENLALVGENGSGKSTIIKLLFRNYDVTSGSILINGINIKDIAFKDLNHNMSILFQDYVSYNFTVKESVVLSNMDKVDSKKIKEATDMVYADDFINKLPNKYNQQLGKDYKDGIEISGGQWQRLALARIIYKNSPVLIIDEGTNKIDAENEYKIFDNLFNLYKDKSLILVAHRYASIKKADKIIVLNDGNLMEIGNHKELMSKETLYKKIYNLQAEQYKEE